MPNSTNAITSRTEGNQAPLRQRILRELRGYVEALAIAFLVVTFLFKSVGVVGSSMQPTLDGGSGASVIGSLLTGDRVFIPKYETWLRRMGVLGPYRPGDVVVVREPPNSPTAGLPERQNCTQELIGLPCRPFLIKRVVAGPGDHLTLEAGTLVLNGQAVQESYLADGGEMRPERQNFPLITQEGGEVTGIAVEFVRAGNGIRYPILPSASNEVPVYSPDHPLVQRYYGELLSSLAPIPSDAPEGVPFLHELIVPEGHYFVMGDNRTPGGSEDSRLFGPVPAITIAGRASAVIWPPMRGGELNWRSLPVPHSYPGNR